MAARQDYCANCGNPHARHGYCDNCGHIDPLHDPTQAELDRLREALVRIRDMGSDGMRPAWDVMAHDMQQIAAAALIPTATPANNS